MRELRQVWGLLDVEWWRIARAVALGALTMVCAIGLTAVSAWLIARASQMPPILTLSVAVVGVRAFGVGRGVARYTERLASHDAALRGMANLRANLYDRLASADLHGHAAAPLFALRRGELLHRVGADVDEVGNLIVRAVVPGAVAVVVGLGSVVLLGTMLPTAGLVLLLGLLAAGVLAPWLAYRATASAEQSLAAAQSEVSSQTLRIIEDGPQLRVAGRLDSAFGALTAADNSLTHAEALSARRLGLAHAIGVLAQALTVILAVVLGAQALAPGGWLATMPQYATDFGGGLSGRVLLAVIVITPMAVFEATAGLPAAAVQFRRSQVAAHHLLTLFNFNSSQALSHSARAASTHRRRIHRPEQDSASASLRSLRRMTSDTQSSPIYRRLSSPVGRVRRQPRIETIGTDLSDSRRLRSVADASRNQGSRRLRSVADASRNQGDPQVTLAQLVIGWPGHRPLLSPLSLDLQGGQTLAIVGPSGIGKTTLLMTIAGLLPPLGGELERQGQALFIGEDDHIFATTVLENLRVAKGDATPKQAKAALQAAGLGAWLEALPQGLDTELGSDATTVSGGERRRLLAARALLSPAQILLLDEPAEHLDSQTADAEVAALIAHAKQTGRILIIATHRPAEANRCDQTLHLP